MVINGLNTWDIGNQFDGIVNGRPIMYLIAGGQVLRCWEYFLV